jgi:type I restriction enzyme S subunit
MRGSTMLVETAERITEEGLRRSSARLLPAGTVLLTSRASIGFTAIAGQPMATNQGFANLVCGPRLLPEFLALWLPTQKDEMLRLAGGTTFKEISKSNLKGMAVPLPPLEEQRRIVDLLSRAAGIRRLAEAAQAKARDLIPALFVSMFGDPTTNPKGWPVSDIGKLLREKPNYGTMVKPTTDLLPWHSLRVANIQRGELSLADKKFVDIPASDVKRHTVSNGDLLMARAIGSIDHLGKCIVARPGEQKWAFDSHLMRIRVDPERVLPEYIKHCFETSGGRRIFLQRVRQSNVQFNINAGELSALQIPVPPINLQKTFVEHVADARSQASFADRAAKTAEALSQSLMARTFAA